MIIAIPSHLKNLKLINQMTKMMEEYSKNFYKDPIESTDDYLDDKAFDYILDLIKVLFPDYDQVTINYLSHLFYECKGTKKIFELIEKHLGLKYLEDPKYDIDTLNFSFSEVHGSNLSVFLPAFTNFVNALLYFDELKIAIDVFKLYITSNVSNESTNNCVCYKECYFEFS